MLEVGLGCRGLAQIDLKLAAHSKNLGLVHDYFGIERECPVDRR
jgi:hypothetical protein